MPSFGILCAAMFRFERERVLHCCLYRGTVVALPVTRILRHDGSIPGRQSHTQSLASRNGNRKTTIVYTKTGTPAIAEMPATSILYSINPLSFKSISISVPRTFFNTTLSISFSLKDNLMSVIGFLSMA